MLYHYVHRLMAKDNLCYGDPVQCFARIIRLYYLCLDHHEAYACLRVLHAQTGMNPTKSALCNVIKELCSRPRTLKQMTRIVIYHAIGMKPAVMASKLPLPPALKEYVVSFEP